jgi:hypothetical protein
MGFSQSTITGINPPIYGGPVVFLSWLTTSPDGTWFQVYINNALSWWGQTTSARITLGTGGPDRVDIGTVDDGEEQTDFSSSLPAAPARRAQLTWLGGTFEGADIAGFKVYQSAASITYGSGGFGGGPFGGTSLVALEADITAYPSGISTDGFGLGGFGLGGFGAAASTYTWTSDPLTNGTWYYAVVPYDSAGNLGDPVVTSVAIAAPPLPPALYADGKTRLTDSYNFSLKEITLNWNASPG